MTKRRVQGGEATSERRRRDGVYQKSARRTHAVLLPNHRRRARVSRASRAWRVRAAKDRAKVGGFALSEISYYPRVRTYHTRKSSRFVNALSPHTQIRATASPVFAFFRAFILNCPRDLDDGDAGRSGNCTCCRICRKCCRRHCYLIR